MKHFDQAHIERLTLAANRDCAEAERLRLKVLEADKIASGRPANSVFASDECKKAMDRFIDASNAWAISANRLWNVRGGES